MSLLKSMRSGLFKGMGIICGGGSVYVEQIINRDDGEALRRDMEAIGNDMWMVIGRENDKWNPLISRNTQQLVSTEPPVREEHINPAVLREQISATVRQIHQGPLPYPDDLVRYEKAISGLADTIMSMALGEQKHRHEMETSVVNSFNVGPWLAFVLGVTSIVAALILLLNGVGWPVLFLIPIGFIPSILSSLYRKKEPIT